MKRLMEPKIPYMSRRVAVNQRIKLIKKLIRLQNIEQMGGLTNIQKRCVIDINRKIALLAGRLAELTLEDLLLNKKDQLIHLQGVITGEFHDPTNSKNNSI